MAFVYESPASDWVKNRYDWTSIPLLYQGEAGSFCSVPDNATVDKERDVIFFLGGGGMGRTSGEFQPYTYILFFSDEPIRCETVTYSVREEDTRKILKEVFRVNTLYLPKQLASQQTSIFEMLSKIALARSPSYDLDGETILPQEFDYEYETKIEVV